MITATFLLYPLLSNCSNTERSKPSAPTLLFDVSSMKESLVLDCITGEVIGVRPRHDMVDVHLLRPSRHTEADQHRKTIFSKIFDNRIWGNDSKVEFSASGRCCFDGLLHLADADADADAETDLHCKAVLVENFVPSKTVPKITIFSRKSEPILSTVLPSKNSLLHENARINVLYACRRLVCRLRK